MERRRLATTGRKPDSTQHYSIDMTIEPFLVPCHLLRLGKIQLTEQAVAPPRRGRSGAAAATSRFELKAETKAKIYERCRCW